MSDLIARLGGPSFAFLVCERDEYWERKGRGQRIVGIKTEYHRHPDALRVPDCVISLAIGCFVEAHPRFNYYGATEFSGAELDSLLRRLTARLTSLRSCTSADEFQEFTTELFNGYCTDSIGPWQEHWPMILDQVTATLDEVLDRVEAARGNSKVLLVLGV